MDKKIFILLPIHNRKEITEKFVHCLKAQSYQNYHLVLLDDGSTDGTEEMVRNQIDSLTVLQGKRYWWWAGALQQGFEWLQDQTVNKSDIILIMNDDTEFNPDFLERRMSVLLEHPNALLEAECYDKSSGKLLAKGVRADWRRLRFKQVDKPEEINCLSTMGLFLSAQDFLNIGKFYPRLLPHFASNYEFTTRAYRKGFKLMTHPSVRLWFREETTWSREIGMEPFFHFLKNLFSKKSAYNPSVWTYFIALASPWRWKFSNWYRIWMGTSLVLIRRILKPIVL